MKNVIYMSSNHVAFASRSSAPVVAVEYLESGLYPIFTGATANELNDDLVTPEIQESAIIGSMFGWMFR